MNVPFEKRRFLPLHLAAQRGFVEAVQELLKHGAKVEATDAEGRTPLAYLMVEWGNPVEYDVFFYNEPPYREGYPAVIQYLLEHGADPYLKDYHGKSAWDYATPEARRIFMDFPSPPTSPAGFHSEWEREK